MMSVLNLSDVTQALVDKLNTQLVKKTLGIEAVEFGDVNIVAKTPTVCFIPEDITHTPTASFMLAEDEPLIYIVIYHGKLESARVLLKECIKFAEAIRDQVLLDKTLGGLITTSWISKMEGGIGQSGDDLLLATRMTWNGKARTQY